MWADRFNLLSEMVVYLSKYNLQFLITYQTSAFEPKQPMNNNKIRNCNNIRPKKPLFTKKSIKLYTNSVEYLMQKIDN